MKVTAAAIGTLDASDDADLMPIVLVDDDSARDPGNVMIRVIHAAPNVPAVKIWEVSGEPTTIVENYAYGQYDFVFQVPAGEYNLGFDIEPADGNPELIFNTGPLPADAYLNVYATNNADGSEVFLIAQLPEGPTVRIDPVPAG